MVRVALLVPVAVMALSVASSFLQPGDSPGLMDARQWREVAEWLTHPSSSPTGVALPPGGSKPGVDR